MASVTIEVGPPLHTMCQTLMGWMMAGFMAPTPRYEASPILTRVAVSFSNLPWLQCPPLELSFYGRKGVPKKESKFQEEVTMIITFSANAFLGSNITMTTSLLILSQAEQIRISSSSALLLSFGWRYLSVCQVWFEHPGHTYRGFSSVFSE
jgi:hypothetical protein